MNNFVTEAALNTKLAILMSASGMGAFFADLFMKYDLMIVKGTATVSFITLCIMAVAKYCKMVNDNRAAREATRVNELLLEKMRLENEKLKQEIEDNNDEL